MSSRRGIWIGTVVAPPDDVLTPVSHSGARRLQDALPFTQVVWLDGGGHCPQPEETGRVAEPSLDFPRKARSTRSKLAGMPIVFALAIAFFMFGTVRVADAQAPPPPPTSPVPAPAPTVAPTVTPSPTPEPETIQPGVRAGGVDLSGQTVEEATRTLRTELGPAARRPVILRVGSERSKLATKAVNYVFDANRTARRALGVLPNTRVELAIRFARKSVRPFVDAFAARVLIPARDAGVRITLRRVYRRKAAAGRRLAAQQITRRIKAALADPRAPRGIRPKLVRTKPNIGAKDLKRRYPAIITVDRSTFTLRLFKRLRFDRTYSVAVGQAAYPTPTGLFSIQSKQVNPTWTAPNSPWAGESAGQSFDSSDPNNPLKARWMGITGSVGFHGTAQDYSIGTAASHGCIRMHVSDVVELYNQVGIGAPVLIR